MVGGWGRMYFCILVQNVRNPTPAFARTAQHHTNARPGCQNRKQDWSCFFFATNSHRVTIAFCPPLQGGTFAEAGAAIPYLPSNHTLKK